MRASACGLLTGVLVAGCFSPTGSVFDQTSSTGATSGSGVGVDTGTGSSAAGTDPLSTTSGTTDMGSSGSTAGGGCGDGQIQDGEECDGEDGCSNECKKEFRRVFVTSQAFAGDLGGLSGADKKCQEAAEGGGFPGKYMAWLSSAEGDPAGRFVHSEVPYRQVDGTEVAADWTDLTDGTLKSGIYLTELKNQPQKGLTSSCQLEVAFAWTSTQDDGTFPQTDDHCSGWSGISGSGITGRVGLSDNGWTFDCAAACQDVAYLYCVEQ